MNEHRKHNKNDPFRWLDGNDTLAVFIHGYLGSPDSFRTLAGRWRRQGIDCAAILLPGHGGGVREFAHSREAEWSAHVRKEIDALRPGYRHVILVGHSLGCLLALNYTAEISPKTEAAPSEPPLAEAMPNGPIRGLILFCTPLRLRLRPFSIGVGLAMFLRPPHRDSPVAAAYRLSYGLAEPLFNPLAMLRPTGALLRVMHDTRKRLAQVRVPTLIIQSHRDETASPASAREIAARLGGRVRIHWLRRSRHAWLHPDEAEAVGQAVDSLLADACR